MTISSTRKVAMWQDLVALLALLVLLAVVIYFWPLSITRVVLSFVCLLFVPGYAVLTTLFPGKHDLENVSRIGLSFGISIVILILVGFVLNYSPWGLRLEVILIGVSGFVVTCCIVAFWRRSNLTPDAQFQIDFVFKLNEFLLLVLALSVAGALGSLIYVVTPIKVEESFTAFYVLGPGGVAGGYPTEVVVDEPTTLNIGVVNHEHSDVRYRIERGIGVDAEQIANLQLGHEQRWEQPYTFVLTEPGENRKVVFLLYKGDDEEPYRSLHLWITVREERATS